MPPLKAPQVYALARQVLEPRLGVMGFKRTPKAHVASWTRPEADKWLTFWFQAWPGSHPLFGAYQFTIEIVLGSDPMVHCQGCGLRLPDLLTDEARATLLKLENRTIAKLPPPNMDFADSLGPDLREFFLQLWQPRTAPYEHEDIWFKHGDEEDVRLLLDFIAAELPGVCDRLLDFCSSYGQAHDIPER